jgi:hypothetical protein
MAMLPADRTFVDGFFASIAPFEKGYAHVAFNYVAVRSGDRFVIAHGRVFFNTTAPDVQPIHFQSRNIRAGRYALSELNLDAPAFVEQLIAGKLATPHGDLHFDCADGGRHAASFVPIHQDGLKSQTRYGVLTIMAGPSPTLPQPDTDWEIKAASRPYEGLHELTNELSLGVTTSPTCVVELVAFNVAAIDAQNSKVSGTSADLRIVLAKGLAPARARLGYRVYAPGTPTTRQVVSGEAMHWTEDTSFRRGQATVTVPYAAVVNCVVSYDDIAQAHQWLGDPDRVQNPRRAVYETFDPKLETLRAAIVNAPARGQDARQLEPAVAWLVWMLGFSVVHLGGTPRTRDAADLIAASPSGNFAVVECTTGLLKAENKLALLHARTEAVRQSLTASNNTHQRVLPVIVTSRTAAEVKPDIEAAERLGILVVTREGIDRIIDRTLILPDGDQVFAEAEQTVGAGLAKYEAQPNLPGIENPNQSSG